MAKKQKNDKQSDKKGKQKVTGWSQKQRDGHNKACKRLQTQEQFLMQEVKQLAKQVKVKTQTEN